ncbi:MAG: WbqC family protein [Candidatus Eisenbacteria bacterium]
MRAAIVQSSYIPWKGYFSLIQLVDHFILYDDVQYTRRDWRNRNRIRTPAGAQWLSIPIVVKGRYLQRVRDAEVSDPAWAQRHWRTIRENYQHAPCFGEIAPLLAAVYDACAGDTHLSTVNRRLVEAVAGALAIDTPLSWSMEYPLVEGRTERLVDLCRQLGADEYLTGPAARDYLDESLFERAGIRVRWMDYGGYPDYAQLHAPPCMHEVSIIDLLMNLGRAGATAYMRAFHSRVAPRLFGEAPSPRASRPAERVRPGRAALLHGSAASGPPA